MFLPLGPLTVCAAAILAESEQAEAANATLATRVEQSCSKEKCGCSAVDHSIEAFKLMVLFYYYGLIFTKLILKTEVNGLKQDYLPQVQGPILGYKSVVTELSKKEIWLLLIRIWLAHTDIVLIFREHL